MADAEYASIKGGEVYHTVHHPDLMGLLDDADRCAELEAKLADARRYKSALMTLFDDSCHFNQMDATYIKEVAGKALGYVE